jgi:hypothetical protein
MHATTYVVGLIAMGSCLLLCVAGCDKPFQHACDTGYYNYYYIVGPIAIICMSRHDASFVAACDRPRLIIIATMGVSYFVGPIAMGFAHYVRYVLQRRPECDVPPAAPDILWDRLHVDRLQGSRFIIVVMWWDGLR